MIISAKFIGTNSLGYEYGKEYELIANLQSPISIKRLDGTGKCPYESLSAFRKNWSVVRTISNS